jgi:hypothetical protein
MKAMLAVPYLQMGEGTLMPDGKTNLTMFDVDTNGLEPAWTALLASCPAAPVSARPAVALPNASAAPAPRAQAPE